jgi:charged multivesicular body protein 6
MLEGNLSNQDEDEVEDELEALRLEVAPKVPQQPVLPDAPVQLPVEFEPEPEPEPEQVSSEGNRTKAKARTALAA